MKKKMVKMQLKAMGLAQKVFYTAKTHRGFGAPLPRTSESFAVASVYLSTLRRSYHLQASQHLWRREVPNGHRPVLPWSAA